MEVPDEDIALVTGHSISKRVPVLHETCFHKKPALARMKQIAILEKYRPDAKLPAYQPGQFKGRCPTLASSNPDLIGSLAYLKLATEGRAGTPPGFP